MNVEKDFQKMCCINLMVQCLVYYCDAFHRRKQKKIHAMQVVTDNNKFPSILVVTSRKVHVKKKLELFSHSFG